MVLKDYLVRNEVIKYSAEPNVEYAGQRNYEVHITNKRLILFKSEGLIFKRDKFVSIALMDLDEVRFEEKGLISKKGIIVMKTKDGLREMKGNMAEVKELFKIIQNQISSFKEEPSMVVKEREITKEVVLIPCNHCRALMPQTSLFCNNCGAKRTA